MQVKISVFDADTGFCKFDNQAKYTFAGLPRHRTDVSTIQDQVRIDVDIAHPQFAAARPRSRAMYPVLYGP